MAQQQIGVGTVANDNTGDPIRDAFVKVNENFDEAYATGIVDGTLIITGNTLSGADATNITIAPGTTGIVVLSVDTLRIDTIRTPASSKGLAGDTLGDITWDLSYIYVCTATWTNGAPDIWARVAITVATW